MQITTDSLNIDDDTVEFSVSYDVSNGNERIRSLTLKMFYDSSQLTWNGLEGDSVLGIHPNKQPLTDLIKYWTSRYGEFQIVKDLTEEELEESDNDDSTDRIVYLLWLYNNAPEKRTFSDWAEYKGFLGDEKLPVKLFTTSFVRADESSGPTRINFKSDSIPSGTMGYGYDFKSQSVTITESADGKVTATGGKAIYRPANGVSVGKVDVADDSSLTNMKELIKKVDSEKLITEGRKKVSSEYIKIIPGVPNNKAFFEGSKAVAIPVFYGVSNDKRDIGGLGLEMSYDSNKLIWRGVRVGSVLGLHSYSKSKLGLSADGVIDNWYRVQHGDGYGELDFLVDNEKLDSGYGSANRGVYFAWIYNHSVNKRTFDDWLGDKGFIGDQELPVKLFTAIFSPVDGFEGSTSIDFKVAPIKKDNIGSDYGFKSIPVDITFD